MSEEPVAAAAPPAKKPLSEKKRAAIMRNLEKAKERDRELRAQGWNPNKKHGFYAQHLSPEEQELFDALYAHFKKRYALDDAADEALLRIALKNIVKSERPEPKTKPGDHNVRSYQAFYETKAIDALKALGITRSQREEQQGSDELTAALNALFRKREAAGEKGAQPGQDGQPAQAERKESESGTVTA